MATSTQPYPLPAGDYPPATYFDRFPLSSPSEYLMNPPTYDMDTEPSQPRANMGFSFTMNQIANTSFFSEGINTSTTSEDINLDISPPSSQYIPSTEIQENSEPCKAALLLVKPEPKPRRRSRNSTKHKEAIQALKGRGRRAIVDRPKPKSRSKKTIHRSEVLSYESQAEGSVDENNPKDIRRRILERNRIAATKCRLRKRDEASAMASQEQAIEDQNRYLSACVNSLMTEIYHLKSQLLCHTDCNCVLIQRYIEKEAKKIVDDLSSDSTTLGYSMCLSTAVHTGSSSIAMSLADSNGTITPGIESVPPTWANSFQQSSGPLEAGDDMFGMALDLFQIDPILVSSQSMSHIPSIEGCQIEALIPRPHLLSPDYVNWGSH